MKTLIKNAYILTMDSAYTEYEVGYLIIEDTKILGLGHLRDLDQTEHFDQVIDAKGGLLLPGFINMHTHLGMIPFRSLGDDTPDRLRKFLFPLEQYMTKELVTTSSEYAMAELMLSGTTTFSDMYYFEDCVATSCEKMGMRGFVGQTIIDMPTCDYKNASDAIKGTEAFITKWQNHPLVTPMIAPHAPNTNTKENLLEIVALSKKAKAPIMMHVSEMTYEVEEIAQKYQQTPVGWLQELGFLDTHFILAHGILLTDEDIELLSKANGLVSVAHCIGANTKSAKGVAPIKALLKEHVSVGLGTDGPSSGNTLDLFTQMKLMENFQKTTLQDRSAFPAREVVSLATKGGAKSLGIDSIVGTLEVGKQADLVLIETESVNMFPIFDPYAVIVYSANASNVSSTWINGQQVVLNKQLVHFDLKKLKTDLNQEMTLFRSKVNEINKKSDR